MDGKSLARAHHSSIDAQQQPTASRRHRKPKKSQHVLCDGQGKLHGQAHDQSPPLFNNRSLSMISTMHHLNPHRKVALSPELLREAEEQATTLKKTVKQLQDQLDKANREKARIHRFLSDLLYTLNARGYESVVDHEGTLVDLNKCKGEAYLELRGRDLKQRVTVRRPGGQEFLLKSVIGNQERAIRSLIYKLDSIGRDILLGNRLCMSDHQNSQPLSESEKVASLEAEVIQLLNLIEGACHKCPDVYLAIRDHYFLNEGPSSELSPRNPVIQNLLKKCEQIAGEAQSRQLVDMLSTSENKLRPKNSASGSGSRSKTSSRKASHHSTKSASSSAERSEEDLALSVLNMNMN